LIASPNALPVAPPRHLMTSTHRLTENVLMKRLGFWRPAMPKATY